MMNADLKCESMRASGLQPVLLQHLQHQTSLAERSVRQEVEDPWHPRRQVEVRKWQVHQR